MSKNDLLPYGTLPKTEWAGRAASNWLWDFERERFEQAGGHPLFSEKDVEYKFNSLGYRCPEFTEAGDLSILALGCSYVFGYAMPQQLIFPEIIRQQLEQETKKKVILRNLSLGGASNDYIARLLQLGMPLLKPDLVLINFTFIARREFVAQDGSYYSFLPGVEPTWSETFMATFKNLSALVNREADKLNFFKNYKACESLLSGARWLFSSVRNNGPILIEHHIDRSKYVGAIYEEGINVDLARDHSHPGPEAHKRIANLYWSKISELGWLRELAG